MQLVLLVLLLNAGLLLGLAAVGWRNRTSLGARWFVALQATSAGWVGLTILSLQLAPTSLQFRLWGLQVATSLVVAVLWLGFILAYTGRERWLRPGRFAVIAGPLLGGAALYAAMPRFEPLLRQTRQITVDVGTIVQPTIGPFGSLLGIYLYGVFLTGLLLVLWSILDDSGLYTGQALALFLGTVVTVVASALRFLELGSLQQYPHTQLALGLQSLLWGYAVFRREFLRMVPGVARIGERTTFEDLDDGIFLVNADGVIVRANSQAEAVFEDTDLLGENHQTLFDGMDDCVSESFPCRFERDGRTYHATTSTVTDRNDKSIGQGLVLRDVTQLVRQQQRLQVLNRILRHNVRNDVTAIRGAASELSDKEDQEVKGLGERIIRRTDSLESISVKAQNIERLTGSDVQTELVEPDALLEEIVLPLSDRHSDAVIEFEANVAAIRTSRLLLSLALEEAIENAIVHGGEPPSISVEVIEAGDAVTFVVTDNGPGIPDWELEPIRAGEETPLKHSSGLGLWLLNWSLQTLEGELTFENTGTGGTVRISVPRSEAVAHSSGTSVSSTMAQSGSLEPSFDS